jgi:hypothetical protein
MLAMDWSGAVCPSCGSDCIRALEVDYPGEPDILYAQCQQCPEGWDVRVTANGVEAAAVIDHGPETGFAPYCHREGTPCVLCDLADAADPSEPPEGW